MQVKICGITAIDDAFVAADAGADFVGLILADSARAVAPSVARDVLERLPDHTRGVLLFRDQALPDVVDMTHKLGGHYVQLHGGETPEYIAAFHAALPEVQIIRARELQAAGSVDQLLAHIDAVRQSGVQFYRVIVDTPKGAAQPDADVFRLVSEAWNDDLPGLWRAGGLTAETVAAAVSGSRFVGVDVARGVEAETGRKDPQRLRRFIQAAKGRTNC